MRVVANTSFEYRGNVYRKGDWIDGVSPELANAWKLMRRARTFGRKPARKDLPLEQPRVKRRYRRRDMRVED